MAQDLTVNIKTTSDVPQAMGKASSAVVGFNKQIEDVQKKFSTGFKDIFLGFAAPMVLIQGIMGFLSKSMEETKRMAKEGLELLATGDSKLVTTEEKRAAAYFKRKKEMEDEKKLVESGKTNVTKQILENKDGEFAGFNLPEEYLRKLREGSETIDSLSKNKDVQRMALEYFNTTDKGKEIEASLAAESKSDQKAGSFKGPEGFGTVVGVGANPVMEKMTRQNELLDQIRMILEEQSMNNRNGSVPAPFTEAVPLTLMKSGLS
jgi:hypothetical protein